MISFVLFVDTIITQVGPPVKGFLKKIYGLITEPLKGYHREVCGASSRGLTATLAVSNLLPCVYFGLIAVERLIALRISYLLALHLVDLRTL